MILQLPYNVMKHCLLAVDNILLACRQVMRLTDF